jgi:hypothetical protein
MKKGFALLVLIFFTTVLIVGSSQWGMSWLTKFRYESKGFLGSDKYLYGDLYGISYLRDFRMVKDVSAVRPPVLQSKQKDISLYVIGDSYFYSSFDIVPTYFERVKAIQFFKWDYLPSAPFSFDEPTTKRVLLIESVERNVFNAMSQERVSPIFEKPQIIEEKWSVGAVNRAIKHYLYHPTLEENLSFAFFDLALFSKIKELKAEFNLSYFGRTPAGVKLAQTKDFLYLDQTVDSLADGSSFQAVSDLRIRQLIERMKQIDRYAKALGFDEVLFSFIPNPSSVLPTEHNRYNQFIPRLEKMVGNELIVVNPTTQLSENAKQNFFKSDSHWNQKGAKIWLDLLNQKLLNLPN